MTGWIVFGCILLFFVFIFSLRARITVEYNDEIRLSVKVLFIKIGILPKKQKKKSSPRSMSKKKAQKIRAQLEKKAEKKRQKELEKQKKKQQKKQQKDAEKKQGKKKKKLSLSDILGLVKMATDVLRTVVTTFFSHLRVDVARCHIKLALGDAATTAIAYGAVSEAAVKLFEALDGLKGFDSPEAQDISINADFLGEATTVDIKVSVSLRVWHLFHVLFAAIGKAIKHLFNIFVKKGK